MKNCLYAVALLILCACFFSSKKAFAGNQCFSAPNNYVCVPDTEVVFPSERIMSGMSCYEGGNEKYICVDKDVVVTDADGNKISSKKAKKKAKKQAKSSGSVAYAGEERPRNSDDDSILNAGTVVGGVGGAWIGRALIGGPIGLIGGAVGGGYVGNKVRKWFDD